MNLQTAYEYTYIGILIFLAILVFAVFVRVMKGPLMADRVVGINSIDTLVIMMVCVLSLSLNESYLLDVALIYAMISFLAVVVLTKVYTGVYKNRIEDARRAKAGEPVEEEEPDEDYDFVPDSTQEPSTISKIKKMAKKEVRK